LACKKELHVLTDPKENIATAATDIRDFCGELLGAGNQQSMREKKV
jgi:hypothetical protein